MLKVEHRGRWWDEFASSFEMLSNRKGQIYKPEVLNQIGEQPKRKDFYF